MTTDTLFALASFAFVSSVTPGPNNLMLMASGANFGLKRTLPHMVGVSLGHGFLILCIGLGLAALFDAVPQLRTALMVGAAIYMGWLAWKIATAAPVAGQKSTGKPLTFLQAAAFQWINPKGWAMGLTAITFYAGVGWRGVLPVVATFIMVNMPSVSIWAMLGTQIARFLHDPRHMRIFNGVMAALLLGSLVLVI